MVGLTEFVQALLFEACTRMPPKDRGEHWEAFSRLGGAKPLAEVVRDGARRFDARPAHRASIEARQEIGQTISCTCGWIFSRAHNKKRGCRLHDKTLNDLLLASLPEEA